MKELLAATAGLMASSGFLDLGLPSQVPPPAKLLVEPVETDEMRIAKAQEKRERKAAKLRTNNGS